MIPDSTTPRQGSRFIYYREDKIIPKYIDRVAHSYQNVTQDVNYDLQYDGHKRTQHSFSLIDRTKNSVASCTVEREVDFLDSSSFKFMSHNDRSTKVARRARDLKEILILLLQKIQKPALKTKI